MNVQDIRAQDWGFSTTTPGYVVEGIHDINQCIVIILSTVKGSDPFRPTFGSDIWEWIDRPLNVALPNMKRAIYEAIGLWEPRVKLTSVDHIYQNEQGNPAQTYAGFRFKIGWELVEGQTTGSVAVTLGLYNSLTSAPGGSGTILITNTGFGILTEQNIQLAT